MPGRKGPPEVPGFPRTLAPTRLASACRVHRGAVLEAAADTVSPRLDACRASQTDGQPDRPTERQTDRQFREVNPGAGADLGSAGFCVTFSRIVSSVRSTWPRIPRRRVPAECSREPERVGRSKIVRHTKLCLGTAKYLTCIVHSLYTSTGRTRQCRTHWSTPSKLAKRSGAPALCARCPLRGPRSRRPGRRPCSQRRPRASLRGAHHQHRESRRGNTAEKTTDMCALLRVWCRQQTCVWCTQCPGATAPQLLDMSPAMAIDCGGQNYPREFHRSLRDSDLCLGRLLHETSRAKLGSY